MPAELYQRSYGTGKFAFSGMDVHHPPDLIAPGKAALMINVTSSLKSGQVQARPGLFLVGQVTPNLVNVHSIKRINSSIPGVAVPFTRLIGAGTNLFIGNNVFAALSGAFSGNPLSIVPYRPPQSPETWAYVYDSLQQYKVKTDGIQQLVGIAAPDTEPLTELVHPLYDLMDTGGAGWAATGTASGVGTTARINTTANAVVYDGAPFFLPGVGWATIAVSTADSGWMQPGAIVVIDGAEDVVIQQIFAAISPTTVAGILFDSLGSGLCTIQPAAPLQGVTRNQILNVGGNWVRVLSVTEGPDGQYSFRCELPFNPAATVGSTITSLPCFRAFLNLSHTTGATITGNSTSATVAAGTGVISKHGPIDLSQVEVPPGGVFRPLTTDDYIHVSLLFDHPELVSEVHVLLDVDAATNDFTRNYYYYTLRQGDFTQVGTGGVTTLAGQLASLQSGILQDLASSSEAGTSASQLPYPAANAGNYAPPNAEQMTSGQSTWFEALFHINDLTRVGTDTSRTLKDLQNFGILVIATGTVHVQFGSWWAGGAYGPDANFNSYGNQGQPVIYRYRYRSLATGARSDVSPATRNGELPRRQGIAVSVIGSSDPQVDVIDIERNGGTFADWHWVITIPNPTGGEHFDTVTEVAAQAGPALELKQYVPWPVTDRPRSGICNVAGTRVEWVAGDLFNPNWIRGIEILINNTNPGPGLDASSLPYTLHGPPLSSTQLDLEQNAGVFSNATFTIPEATIAGQPLPFAWGPEDNRIFACGDPYNPGFLYFSNQEGGDSAADDGYIEVTSPSEPLQNGFIFEGANYVFSTSYLYRIEPTPGGVNPYAAYRLSGVYGLAAPWAFTADSPSVFFLGSDGIYIYNPSGGAENITDEDLYFLFPHESTDSQPVSFGITGYTLYPLDYAQRNQFRLSFADNLLYFNYTDTFGQRNTLVYDLLAKGWRLYSYLPGNPVTGAVIHYQERESSVQATLVGGGDGNLYQVGGVFDNDLPYGCLLLTRAEDQGDSRARKQYGDGIVDFLGLGVVFTGYFDNYLSLGPIVVPAVQTTRGQLIFDLAQNNFSLHRNIALLVTWQSTKLNILYEWQPSFIIKPEDTQLRATDWDDEGTPENKFLQGLTLCIDTAGVTKRFAVQTDAGFAQNFTVSQNGQGVVALSFDVPLIGHAFRILPLDAVDWRMFPYNGKSNGIKWIWEPHPELAKNWITQTTSHGMNGYHHHRWSYIALQSTDNVVLGVNVDGVPVYYLIPSTGGEIRKVGFALKPQKGKLSQYSVFSCTPFRLFQKDCEVRVKQWGSNGPFEIQKPFGDLSFERGARI